jgi:hypothetical protein
MGGLGMKEGGGRGREREHEHKYFSSFNG